MTDSRDPSVSVRIPQEYLAKIQELVEASGRTRSEILLEAITAYLGVQSANTITDLEQVLKRIQDLEENTFTRLDTRLEELEKKVGRAVELMERFDGAKRYRLHGRDVVKVSDLLEE